MFTPGPKALDALNSKPWGSGALLLVLCFLTYEDYGLEPRKSSKGHQETCSTLCFTRERSGPGT